MIVKSQTAVLALSIVGLIAPVSAQMVVVIDNTDCVIGDEHPCCPNACDNKAKWEPVKFKHQYIELCASFWTEDTCASTRLGDLVAEGICTQQEVDNADPLQTVNCTENRAEAGWCRSNAGCVALDDPWGCCDDLDTGTCPYTDSPNTPEPTACRKTWQYEMVRVWKALRKDGQRQWKAEDDPPFVADDSDVN